MAKDKFTQRKARRQKVRGEMTKRGIKGKDIAAQLGIGEMAVSKGCATSPRIVAALLEAGVPARCFDQAVLLKARAYQEAEKVHRLEACATGDACVAGGAC